jgi:hypothetical protein
VQTKLIVRKSRGLKMAVNQTIFSCSRSCTVSTPPDPRARPVPMRTPQPAAPVTSSLNQQTNLAGRSEGVGRTPQIIEATPSPVKPLADPSSRAKLSHPANRPKSDSPELWMLPDTTLQFLDSAPPHSLVRPTNQHFRFGKRIALKPASRSKRMHGRKSLLRAV